MGPCAPALSMALVALSPWRTPLLPTAVLVPVRISHLRPAGKGPAPNPKLHSIVQHNCLASWDVSLSLFELFKEATTYPSGVLLQDPPVNKAHLPSFNGCKSFFPPARKPRVAAHAQVSPPAPPPVLPRFTEVDDILALDLSSLQPLFGTNSHFFG